MCFSSHHFSWSCFLLFHHIFVFCRRAFYTGFPLHVLRFCGMFCKDSFHIFHSLVLDFYAHTIRSRHSIFHAAYVSFFLKCDMCVNLEKAQVKTANIKASFWWIPLNQRGSACVCALFCWLSLNLRSYGRFTFSFHRIYSSFRRLLALRRLHSLLVSFYLLACIIFMTLNEPVVCDCSYSSSLF